MTVKRARQGPGRWSCPLCLAENEDEHAIRFLRLERERALEKKRQHELKVNKL